MFPSKTEACAAINELEAAEGVDQAHMHAIAREDVDIQGLPPASERQRHDVRSQLSWVLWNSDLAIFFVAFIGLLLSIYVGSVWAAIASFSVMAVSFASGAFYAIFVPDISLDEFDSALAHREVLVLIDVPKTKVDSIERRINHHHPSGVASGSSWTADLFDI
jgi:hypothetical protein